MKATALEQEQFTLEALKTDIYNFRQLLVAKKSALAKYLQVLKQGVGSQQNRAAVEGTAKRSQEALTPGNLVRATHKTGKVEKAKLKLDDEAQVLGAFATFTHAELVRMNVALNFLLKKESQKKIDPEKLCVRRPRLDRR